MKLKPGMFVKRTFIHSGYKDKWYIFKILGSKKERFGVYKAEVVSTNDEDHLDLIGDIWNGYSFFLLNYPTIIEEILTADEVMIELL